VRRKKVIETRIDEFGKNEGGAPAFFFDPGWTPLRVPEEEALLKRGGWLIEALECNVPSAVDVIEGRARDRGYYYRNWTRYKSGLLKTNQYHDRENNADDRAMDVASVSPAAITVSPVGSQTIDIRLHGAFRISDDLDCMNKLVTNRSAPWVVLELSMAFDAVRRVLTQEVSAPRSFPSIMHYRYAKDGSFKGARLSPASCLPT